MLRPVVLSLAALALASTAHAQASDRPSGWRLALDRADAADSAFDFVRMTPGWHVTADAGGVAYDTAHAVRGRVRVESQLFLFSKAPGAGAGVMLGGARDAAGTLRYTAFVVGPDGRFRITRHEGSAMRDLVPWTAHAAVTPHPGNQPNVRERLAVEADDAAVRFSVNGTVVATLPRASAEPDGVVGLRADPGANAHVATLVVNGRNVAPAPPAR